MSVESICAVVFANSAERIMSQPFKTIEVIQQSNPKLSLIEAVKHVYSKGGCRGFYAGFVPYFVGANLTGARWGFYKGGYSFYESVIQNHPSLVTGCVAVTSALGETVLGCPFDNWMKLRMTGNPKVWNTIRAEGPGCLFRGFRLSFLISNGSLGAYLVSFQYFKQLLLARNGKAAPPLWTHLVVSAAAGTVSRLIHAPLETLLTQVQKENPMNDKKLYQTARSFVKENGIKGLYRGLPVRLIRSNCYASITYYLMHQMNMLPEQMKIK